MSTARCRRKATWRNSSVMRERCAATTSGIAVLRKASNQAIARINLALRCSSACRLSSSERAPTSGLIRSTLIHAPFTHDRDRSIARQDGGAYVGFAASAGMYCTVSYKLTALGARNARASKAQLSTYCPVVPYVGCQERCLLRHHRGSGTRRGQEGRRRVERHHRGSG